MVKMSLVLGLRLFIIINYQRKTRTFCRILEGGDLKMNDDIKEIRTYYRSESIAMSGEHIH